MNYDKERDHLIEILLSSKDIRQCKNTVLELVPELVFCDNCLQSSTGHKYDVLGHILEATNLIKNIYTGTDKEGYLTLRLALLLHDIGKPYKKHLKDDRITFNEHSKASYALVHLILERLNFDKTLASNVSTIVKYHSFEYDLAVQDIKDMIGIVGTNVMPLLLYHKTADLSTHSDYYANLKSEALKQTIHLYKTNFDSDFKINLPI